jgi:hypothetical protein
MSRFYNIFQAYPETTNFLNIDTGKWPKTLAAVSKWWSAVQDSKKVNDIKETSNLNISDDIIRIIDEMILEESEKRELKKI